MSAWTIRKLKIGRWQLCDRTSEIQSKAMSAGSEQNLGVVIRNRKGARKITIRVDHKGVTVTKPSWVSRRDAESFLSESHAWIQKQLDARQAVPRDRVYYRGDECRVLEASVPPVRFAESQFWAPGDTEEERLEAVMVWLKRRSRPLIREAVHRWGVQMGVQPTRIGLRDQTSRWGSCSSTGSLSFNWRLVMAPVDVLEYIVVHELAHLVEHNHSRRFWQIVEHHCPMYRQCEDWLDTHGERLLLAGRV